MWWCWGGWGYGWCQNHASAANPTSRTNKMIQTPRTSAASLAFATSRSYIKDRPGRRPRGSRKPAPEPHIPAPLAFAFALLLCLSNRRVLIRHPNGPFRPAFQNLTHPPSLPPPTPKRQPVTAPS
jgi:hypothetical protein